MGSINPRLQTLAPPIFCQIEQHSLLKHEIMKTVEKRLSGNMYQYTKCIYNIQMHSQKRSIFVCFSFLFT